MKRLDRLVKKAKETISERERKERVAKSLKYVPMYFEAVGYCCDNDMEINDENIKTGLAARGYGDFIDDLFEWKNADRSEQKKPDPRFMDESLKRMYEYFGGNYE